MAKNWDIYQNDFRHQGQPHGRINLDKSNICVDLRCECGHFNGHYDGHFFYFYQCSKCGKKYAVGRHIKLIPLTDKQVERFDERQFHTDNHHMDFFITGPEVKIEKT